MITPRHNTNELDYQYEEDERDAHWTYVQQEVIVLGICPTFEKEMIGKHLNRAQNDIPV